MKLRDICRVCNSRLAEYTCKSCGALVCERDYDKATGFCIICKQEKKR